MKGQRECSLAVVVLLMAVTSAIAQETESGDLPDTIGFLTYSHTIGDSESFGEVTDVATSGDGVIAVLDALFGRISAYGVDGMLLSHFGTKGAGPGEFFAPVSVEWQPEHFLVLDRGNIRLTSISLEGDSISLAAEVRPPLTMPRDLCVIGDRTFVLSSSEGFLIHEVSKDGGLLRSFGAVVPDDPVGGTLSAVGSLACSPAGVALASSVLGYLQVYSPDGQLKWQGAIDGFERQQYETNGGGFRPLPPSAGYVNQVVSIWWMEDDRILVQLSRSDEREAALLEGRLLSLTNGWIEDAPEWPRLLYIEGTLHVFEEVAPVPLLKAYRER